jgi:hypothetical protein
MLWMSRPRFFHKEAGNIGSQLITMTLLRNRTACTAPPKKQLRIKGKMVSLSGLSMTHLSRAWSMPRSGKSLEQSLAEAGNHQAKAC